MELGAYGPSIGMEGYRNYATEAFLLYLTIAFLCYKLFGKLWLNSTASIRRKSSLDSTRFRKTLVIGTSVLFLASFLMVIPFDGLNTILGHNERGAYRTNLGIFGSLAYFFIKYLAPGVLAGIFVSGRMLKKNLIDWLLIFSSILFAVLIALSFGFKSGVVTLFLPTLIAIQPKLTLKGIFVGAAVTFGVIILGYYAFENLEETGLDFVFMLLMNRLTVMSGDVPWHMWNLLISGETFPSYWATLPAVLGDRLLALITGVTADRPYEWVMLHSALIPTYLSGYAPYEIAEGHNNTATSFSEGILFGGFWGIFVFAILTGFIARFSIYWVEKSSAKNDIASTSVAACFAVHSTWAWFISGGINMFAHISIVFNLLLLYVILKSIFYNKPNKTSFPRNLGLG
ncbi:MAG: oligosaccharide repeat unit polymerase [Gallionellaceae bacterium]